MIEIKNLSFKYKNKIEVLENINLTIQNGEIVSIIGKNGVGKSTLVKLLAGLLKPTSGNIYVDELDIYDKKNIKYIRKNMGVVFQNPDNQILYDNVYDDIEFALKNLELDGRDQRIKKSLEEVGMLEYKNSNTYSLSLGQKQRINIASALALEPSYLILDEPTTMIDPKGKERIYEIIKNVKKNKKTIIYITNNINEILISDRIIILDEHKIKHMFLKKDLLENIDKLEDADVCLPDIIKIVLKLNKNGFNISIDDYTADELANKIISEFKR